MRTGDIDDLPVLYDVTKQLMDAMNVGRISVRRSCAHSRWRRVPRTHRLNNSRRYAHQTRGAMSGPPARNPFAFHVVTGACPGAWSLRQAYAVSPDRMAMAPFADCRIVRKIAERAFGSHCAPQLTKGLCDDQDNRDRRRRDGASVAFGWRRPAATSPCWKQRASAKHTCFAWTNAAEAATRITI